MVGSNPQLALICLMLLNLVISFNSAIIKEADKSAIPNIEAIYNARSAMAKDDIFNATFTDEDFKEIVSYLNYHQQSNSFSEITNTDFLNLIKNKVTNKVKVHK